MLRTPVCFRILSKSLTSVLIFFVCCYSRLQVSISVFATSNKEIKHMSTHTTSLPSHRFHYYNFPITVQVTSAFFNYQKHPFSTYFVCCGSVRGYIFDLSSNKDKTSPRHLLAHCSRIGLADFPQQRFIVFTQMNLRHAVYLTKNQVVHSLHLQQLYCT